MAVVSDPSDHDQWSRVPPAPGKSLISPWIWLIKFQVHSWKLITSLKMPLLPNILFVTMWAPLLQFKNDGMYSSNVLESEMELGQRFWSGRVMGPESVCHTQCLTRFSVLIWAFIPLFALCVLTYIQICHCGDSFVGRRTPRINCSCHQASSSLESDMAAKSHYDGFSRRKDQWRESCFSR